MARAVQWFIWMSPFFRLGIFFPIGAWMLFFSSKGIRKSAFLISSILVFQFFFHSVREGWDLVDALLDSESDSISFPGLSQAEIVPFWVSFYSFIFLVLDYLYLKITLFRNPLRDRVEGRYRFQNFRWVFLTWFSAVFFSVFTLVLLEEIGIQASRDFQDPIRVWVDSLTYSLALFYFFFSKGRVFFCLEPIYLWLIKSELLRRSWVIRTKDKGPESFLAEVREETRIIWKRAVLIRDSLLPGWGHIYIGDYWRGFSLLFLFLLVLFLLATGIFSFLSPISGIQFLGSWGLKPGIPDKVFFQEARNPFYILLGLVLFLSVYLLSWFLLRPYWKIRKEEEKPKAFLFYRFLPLSLIVHLTLLSIFIIIPFTLQRKKSSDESQKTANHFQPENMEFYFIDPNLPDEIKDLNGGIFTGTESPDNREEGEKISDEKAADNGPQKGFIKKIRGKKVPATYSNYISAKMRGPEKYLDYWKRAPQPYSCVVAYTITADGDVEDIQIVEASQYPDQDILTIELIESLSPLMAPPSKGKDIRVTELFWNGSLDPEAMPTLLQKEMVTHFDGRYMEEIE
jgi:hypothetical protein